MKCIGRMYMLLLPVALAGLAACSAGHKAAPAAEPEGWNPSALRTAEQLADKLRAAGVACDEYTAVPFESFDEAYKRRMPVPGSFTSCTSEEEEIIFQVFADPSHVRQFLDAKQAFLCAKAKSLDMPDFPGFLHVDGDTWVIELNDKEFAEKLAGILGGKVQQIPCNPANALAPPS